MIENSQQTDHTPSTLFVRNLPYSVTPDSLSDFFSQVGPVKNVIIVTDPTTHEPRGIAFISYSLKEDAKTAAAEFDGKLFQGRNIRIDFAKPKRNTPTSEIHTEPKNSRLIIRNLPWSIRENKDLEKVFIKFGGVKQVNIPRKQHGRMSGFAFVTMKKQRAAEKAIKELNGTTLDGRIIAVDFALPKDKWENVKEESDEEGSDGELNSEKENVEKDVDINQESDSEDTSDEVSVSPEQKTPPRNILYDDCTLFIRNLLFETTEEELNNHFSKFGRLRYAKIVVDSVLNKPRGMGFVCFHSREDANKVLLLASKVPKINSVGDSVMDPQDPDGIANQFRLNGRVMLVSKAVNRVEAEKLKGKPGRKLKDGKVDKRNLFLLNEGGLSVIRCNTNPIAIPSTHPLAQVLSSTDLNLRSQSLKQRRKLLAKNPTLHLSLTRLSVRNIPRYISSTDLKALGRKAIVQFAVEVKSQKRAPLTREEKRYGGVVQKGRKSVVKQAKVVTEPNGRSRGFGFIEFSSHRHALMGLRWLNAREISACDSSAEISDKTDRKRRLIVEFAIENVQVVKRRVEREQKARDKAALAKLEILGKTKKRKREENIQDDLERQTKRIILQKRKIKKRRK